MTKYNVYKVVITFIFLLMTVSNANATNTSANASTNGPKENPRNVVATITKTSGTVKYHENNSPRSKKVAKNNFATYVNDRIRTKNNARADLNLIDDSRIILLERSSIYFSGIKQIAAEQGLILFDISEQARLSGFQIKSKVAVIGVKGTQFIVDSDANNVKIYMKEGLVSIEPIDGEFKHYKRKDKEAFDTFKKDIKEEFETFNKELEQEFIEFVKYLELGSGKAISIAGNEVRNINIPKNILEYFAIFDENKP